ncbi:MULTISPECIES: signal peptidase I [Thalassospira]|jgi:signal peptidase I|uniref:Signal peptidase I n=1 Tax=Thalassospira tepidiphila MCCC 1A03514 TaxID=1177930 RepID=A0A853KY58_9PROT|nr:signal peptidase I [Thalassospira profundimaris WP0211]KXJ52148.1 MAG: S26 family signal peptidase [Thalassospira sp. Nap_22]MBE71944.1 signal peptidase I [Thalassospira sp.]OAZ09481.1 signal peptidase [Thalassospira tepidiphila MCCC 1A03514]QPO13464.1 signal peptidase I [Thalassospira sp. A40-3]BDW88860.1 signal peptidase I [Thalassospira tepidiphila]|tara:strand:+ start:166 stop:912 length:747 start_codon:yes stop_codon:yes gene_type:complete
MEKLVHKKKTGGLLDTLKTVFWAIVIALMVRTFAFEPFNIPSGSMIPTLLVGDYLFVSKFSYGYSKHSMPFSLPIIPGRVFESEPERGDVVVFKLPSDTSQDYIKRVIGLPGDTVQVKEGRLYINNKMIERERIEDYILTDGGGRSAAVPQYIETLPNGRVHRILEMFGDQGPSDNTEAFTVPEGHFFMMGDNRDNSADSRAFPSRFRFVPIENLVGRAEFLFYSKDSSQPVYDLGSIRFDRLFQGVN